MAEAHSANLFICSFLLNLDKAEFHCVPTQHPHKNKRNNWNAVQNKSVKGTTSHEQILYQFCSQVSEHFKHLWDKHNMK